MRRKRGCSGGSSPARRSPGVWLCSRPTSSTPPHSRRPSPGASSSSSSPRCCGTTPRAPRSDLRPARAQITRSMFIRRRSHRLLSALGRRTHNAVQEHGGGSSGRGAGDPPAVRGLRDGEARDPHRQAAAWRRARRSGRNPPGSRTPSTNSAGRRSTSTTLSGAPNTMSTSCRSWCRRRSCWPTTPARARRSRWSRCRDPLWPTTRSRAAPRCPWRASRCRRPATSASSLG
uniref:Uncharacterized protein n=1 Tax=Setaria viridis TaxID=4556 RepID=A0A4U6V2N5_SETVI|nr:hypothetical protein SEVIR_4G204901v2 [Setaria viridis]